MKYRTRTYYTDKQKSLMWERWKQGWTLHQIAHLFNRAHTSVQGILARTGGIRPPGRSRSPVALSLAEREEISRLVVAGQSIRSIAARLGRAPSTISRELKRNGGAECYRAIEADSAAWTRACRPKVCKLVSNRALAGIVSGKLRMLWSPEQIAGWLKHTYPQRRALPRVTRDHLPQPVHPSAWRLEEGAVAAPEAHKRDASLTPLHPENRASRTDRGCRVHQRSPSDCRGPSCAWSLGRRLVVR